MGWDLVVAGLEALGTGAVAFRPAVSFLDVLEKAGRVLAPTQSKRAFDEQSVEEAGVLGDENALVRLVTDPTPPPPLDLLKKWVSYTKKLDSRGDFVGTGHKRIAIPKTNISEDELRRLGFQSVLAGIPETGQDRFKSFRRVDDNHHLHSHPDYWTLHLDAHPSMTMALQKAEGPLQAAKAVTSGMSHVLTEGVPGAYYYLKGQMGGGDGMVGRLGRLARIRKKHIKKAALYRLHDAVTIRWPGVSHVGQNSPEDRMSVITKLAEMMSGFTVDQPRGSYRQFRDPSDAALKDYPIEGVTYPTDYGYLPGYVGEDDDDLDVFKGSGGTHGVMRVNRPDARGGAETKLLYGMTPEEMSAVLKAFGPVVNSHREVAETELADLLSSFKRPNADGKMVKIAGLPAIKIDRPKGFQKVFPTPAGPVTKSYPVDYGYFDGIINPDDNEGADVFVGDGTLHGRFMKGKNLSGKWEPDERKWFLNLTPEQLVAVKEMFTSQSPDLLRDEVQFADESELARDLASLRAKTAEARLHDLLYLSG
jgi:inorganic pyrophosphatase/uncharacterized protein YjeT (DUF2065 family)